MDYLVLVFVSKFAVEVTFYVAKTCYKRYKATKKPGDDTPSKK